MFKFELEQWVAIHDGNESGKVIGRSGFTVDENRYLVRYVAGDGRSVESWWAESALSAAK